MKWTKKILILIIFIVFSIILFRLLAERRKIKSQFEIEGAWFGSASQSEELNKIKTTDVPASIVNTAIPTLSLKQYCIKGSYNSAITGKYVNLEMIKYLFSRGVRFLDFEVFSFDKTPYVAMSTDSTYSSIDTNNKETLQDVLAAVMKNAFAAPAINMGDPVFIHLRIKTNQIELYDKIAGVIDYVLKSKMLLDSTGKAAQITGDTILKDLNGKIIILLDKTSAPTYRMESNLASYVNMESGSDTLRKYSYSVLSQQMHTSPQIMDYNINTDVKGMKLVIPDIGSSLFGTVRNSKYDPMVLNYGAQIVLYPFYQKDQYLDQYEAVFATNKSAFVPISKMLKTLNPEI